MGFLTDLLSAADDFDTQHFRACGGASVHASGSIEYLAAARSASSATAMALRHIASVSSITRSTSASVIDSIPNQSASPSGSSARSSHLRVLVPGLVRSDLLCPVRPVLHRPSRATGATVPVPKSSVMLLPATDSSACLLTPADAPRKRCGTPETRTTATLGDLQEVCLG